MLCARDLQLVMLFGVIIAGVDSVKTLSPKPNANKTSTPAAIVSARGTPIPTVLLDYEDKTQMAKCSSKWSQTFAHVKKRFSDQALQEHCKTGAKWVKQAVTIKKAIKLSDEQLNWLSSVWKCKDLICLCRAVPFCNKFLVQIESGLNRLKGMNDNLDKNARALREFLNNRTGPNTIVKIKKPKYREQSRSKRQTVQDLADVIESKVGKAQRKEIRMMNNEERRAFFKGVAKLKVDMLGDKSKYDLLTMYHTPEQSPEAHFCASFLPFHRELLKNMEVAMRQLEPGAALAYWDTTLDEPLPDPRDSVLWTEELVGNGDGDLMNGPFANFSAFPDNVVAQLSSSGKVVRNVGQSPFGSLIKESDVQTIMSKGSFKELVYCTDPYLELVHGGGHMWVGGHMLELRTAPNDPVFFMYHAFIDAIWEQWRQQKQNSTQRQFDYPSDTDSCNSFCSADADMKPFPMKNIDGLSNLYMYSMYSYDLRPSCNRQSPSCGSPYLFCNTQTYKCMSKVKPNGNCTGFESQDICYKSTCNNGKCKAAAENTVPEEVATFPPSTIFESTQSITTIGTAGATPLLTTTTFTLPPIVPSTKPYVQPTIATEGLMKTVWIPISVIKMNGQNAQQSYPDANIISTDLVHGVKFSGVISDPSKIPFYTGASFAQVLNPFSVSDGVEATIEVYDENSQKCAGFCYNTETSIYESCSPKVSLSSNILNSDDTPYTPNFEQARVINWNGNKRRPDKFMFMCYFPAETEPNVNTVTHSPLVSTTQTTVVIKGDTGDGTNVNINSVSDNATSQVLNGGCMNMHRCCIVWSGVGECKRNPWMQQYCQKDCGVCQAGSEISPALCVDFDAQCPDWKGKQQCTRNPLWMEENCKKSCDVCNRNIAELLVMCGASGGAASTICAHTLYVFTCYLANMKIFEL